MMCNRPREWKLRTNGDETAVMTELEFTRAKVGPWMIVSRKGRFTGSKEKDSSKGQGIKRKYF